MNNQNTSLRIFLWKNKYYILYKKKTSIHRIFWHNRARGNTMKAQYKKTKITDNKNPSKYNKPLKTKLKTGATPPTNRTMKKIKPKKQASLQQGYSSQSPPPRVKNYQILGPPKGKERNTQSEQGQRHSRPLLIHIQNNVFYPTRKKVSVDRKLSKILFLGNAHVMSSKSFT